MNDNIYSVSQLNSYIKRLLENDYVAKNVKIQGEISNCKIHSSNHVYFTLKDSQAAISCVLFKGYRQNVSCELKDGIKVIASGSISVYERTGQYQLYVKELFEDGVGYLYKRFEELKVKLANQGLFAKEVKKSIPFYPRCIGIVTSDTGAAIRDIVQVAKRRNPYMQLVLYPSTVQGDTAKFNLVEGIKYLDQQEEVDVIIVGRGGGAIEDLWPFNEEMVAQAIYNAKTPIISAVGHEIDYTISDFVADARAATPSEAAEIAVKPIDEITDLIDHYQYKLYNLMDKKKEENINKIKLLSVKMALYNPVKRLNQWTQYLIDLEDKMNRLFLEKLKEKRHQLKLHEMKLIGLSPMDKLKNGYVYLSDIHDKQIDSIDKLQVGQPVNITFIDGQGKANITEIIGKKGNNG
jgi:exodeoxyribonuclease VII large subunit